jgi:hypothetical protein
MCPNDAALLAALRARGVTITVYDSITYHDPFYDGRRWTTKRFDAGGDELNGSIRLVASGGAKENAATLYHEGIHAQQPASWTLRQKEVDAYSKEEDWRQAHHMPPFRPDFRQADPVLREAAINNYLTNNYPGMASPAAGGGGIVEWVDGVCTSQDKANGVCPTVGWTKMMRSNNTSYYRPPRSGDTYPDRNPVIRPPTGMALDVNRLQCP